MPNLAVTPNAQCFAAQHLTEVKAIGERLKGGEAMKRAGIPIPGHDGRITQDNNSRVTQQTGEAPGGFNGARARGVLEAVRDMSDWNNRSKLPKGTGKGVAFQFAHSGYVAYVVEAQVDAEKKVNITKVWCAVDIGRQIVNPGHSTNLVQGGFIEGMSHMMSWNITIE